MHQQQILKAIYSNIIHKEQKAKESQEIRFRGWAGVIRKVARIRKHPTKATFSYNNKTTTTTTTFHYPNNIK